MTEMTQPQWVQDGTSFGGQGFMAACPGVPSSPENYYLVKAEQIAPEELAESPRIAELIDDIESLNKRTHLPALRELRRRLYG
ncbi:MAG TPA: hypothetical protein VEF72_06105 [Mycobacterium sp.]|nr:hypothetical protein [Mycobacterium sp.]